MGEKILVSFTKPQIGELDRMVERGIYLNRSEAIRDACRMLIRQHFGSIPLAINPVEAVKKARKELRNEALRRAGGDKDKAYDELIKILKE